MNKKLQMIIVVGVMMLAGMMSTVRASMVAIDFGGDYTAVNINATKVLNVDATVDADFDGTADDRAGSIAVGTVFTPPNSPSWTTPSGKSGAVIKFGSSVANINSVADPADLSTSRISTTDIIQTGNAAGTTTMRMASAWYWEKAYFLNGADAAANLSFLDGTASLSAYFSNGGTPTTGYARTGNFLVQNGSDWYISKDKWTSTGGTLAINAADAEWYVFDPLTGTLFWDRASTGTAVLGSTLTDITALGLYVQHDLFNGSTANYALQGFTSFQATVIPEPATIGLLGLGAFFVLVARRMRQ